MPRGDPLFQVNCQLVLVSGEVQLPKYQLPNTGYSWLRLRKPTFSPSDSPTTVHRKCNCAQCYQYMWNCVYTMVHVSVVYTQWYYTMRRMSLTMGTNKNLFENELFLSGLHCIETPTVSSCQPLDAASDMQCECVG